MGDSDIRPTATTVEEKALNGNGTSKPLTRMPSKSGSGHANMNGPLYMQSGKNVVLVRRVKRKDQGVWKSLAQWLVENQTGMSHLSLPPSWF
jgi:very-long-chain ceramide synthase